MDVFVSWSGSRSRAVAQALRHFLPNVLPGVRTWMSDEDIGAGVIWAQAVGTKLDSTDFGVICTTPAALDSKWVTFEAGALSKRVGSARVVPYLIGMAASDVDGPLSMFQAVRADRKGTLDLIATLKEASKENGDSGNVNDRFDAFWPKLQALFDALPDTDEAAPIRPEREMLGEVLTTVRMMASLYELASLFSELGGIDDVLQFDEASMDVSPENRRKSEEEWRQRQRDGMRIMRYVTAGAPKFLRGAAGEQPGSESALMGGFAHLASELEWSKDRAALLAAHIIVAQRMGAELSSIISALERVAVPREVSEAATLAQKLVPRVAGKGGGGLAAAPLVPANPPLQRAGRKAPRR